MKKVYKITLLTPSGLKTEIFNSEICSLEQFTEEMILKYKTFTTYKSEEITP